MKRGPPPKSTARRQRRNRQPRLEVHTGAAPDVALEIRPDVPPYPKRFARGYQQLLLLTRRRWDAFWASDLSMVVADVDLPLVERLFQRYDERDRAYREIRKKDVGRLCKGSQGQPILHPLLKYIDNCDSEIRQMEDRLGMSPVVRLKMGVALAGANKTIEETNDGLYDTDQEDPR